MLTKAQLKKIEEIVRKRILSFKFEALGERALTSEEIDQLKAAGLLNPSVRNFTGDAYTLGKIASRIDRELARGVTYEQVLKMARKLPMTTVEKRAIQFAKDHAGEYITKIGDDLVREVRGESARTALGAVRNEVSSAIELRETTSQLKTRLFAAIDDKNKDWDRVAATEMQTAIQHGIYQDIHENYGGEQLVYKRPSPSACKHCIRLHLEDDNITPRVFKMTDLEPSNIGRKANNWVAVIGPVHPWCQCQLHIIPEGFSFVKNKVADKPFTFEGKKYGAGAIVPATAFAGMSPEVKQNVRDEAIMGFTGKTAKLSKSVGPLDPASDYEAISEV